MLAVAAICCTALIILLPNIVSNLLQNVFALSNVALFLFAAGVLMWFAYSVILRRILRARRIAHARMKRMLREAADRGSSEEELDS